MSLKTTTKNILLFPFNILYKISPETDLKILFYLKQKYKLNLKNPKTFNEKLQWVKLYDRNPLMPKCVDKFQVRKYVEEKGCSDILNELYWEGFNPEDIPYDKLPNQFVIKVTHGSTFNIIVNDKNKLDKKQTEKTLKKWLKSNFLLCYGEWFYGVEKPRIIIEKFIESDDLKDYKIFCFNGKAKIIGVYSNRFKGKTCQEIYNCKWEKIEGKTGNFSTPQKSTEKPRNLDNMIKKAEILSKDFRHVRVDFYYENDKIIFGEMTFTSGAGFDNIKPYEFDLKLGSYLNIESNNGR